MNNISISEAANRLGVSRQALDNYLKSFFLTFSREKCVEGKKLTPRCFEALRHVWEFSSKGTNAQEVSQLRRDWLSTKFEGMTPTQIWEDLMDDDSLAVEAEIVDDTGFSALALTSDLQSTAMQLRQNHGQVIMPQLLDPASIEAIAGVVGGLVYSQIAPSISAAFTSAVTAASADAMAALQGGLADSATAQLVKTNRRDLGE